MRLHTLSLHPNKPCLVLKLPRITVMFDCALDLNSLLHFLPVSTVQSARINGLPVWKNSGALSPSQSYPQLKDCCRNVFVDGLPEVLPPESRLLKFDEIDVIVISNYSTMIALPFITEHTGFKGIVLATDPTMQLGTLMINELVEYMARCQKAPADSNWKSDSELFRSFPNQIQGITPSAWKRFYSEEDATAALGKITVVAYREKVDLFGCAHAIPSSSGHCIGGANWAVETEYERFAYISGSSAFVTHPKAIDIQPLTNANALFLTCLSQCNLEQNAPDENMKQVFQTVHQTIQSGGNVLIPCYPSGLVYDLFEFIADHLAKHSCANTPLYFVSPAAESSLAFSNIYGEWLADHKMSRIFMPEEPFNHGLLLKDGRLQHFSAVYDGLSAVFKPPCVVFAGHASLRLGDSVHFMELWRNDPNSSVILVEPDFSKPEVIAPFQPLQMKAFFFPIDTNLDFAQARLKLQELKPRKIYTPDVYLKPPMMYPDRTDLCLTSVDRDISNFVGIRRNHVISIPMYRKFEKMRVDPSKKIAENIRFETIASGFQVASISGYLSAYDNKLELQDPKKLKSKTIDLPSMDSAKCACIYGGLNVDSLLKSLKTAGFDPQVSTVDSTDSSVMVKINEHFSLSLKKTGESCLSATKIDEICRNKITDCIVSVMDKL